MRKLWIYLVLGMILAVGVLADTQIPGTCDSNAYCEDLCDSIPDWDCYCSANKCYRVVNATNATIDNETTPAINETLLEDLQLQIEDLELLQLDLENVLVNFSADVENRVSATENSIEILELEVLELQTLIQGLTTDQGNLKANFDTKVTTIATGLAGLQENIDEAQTDLEGVESQLHREQVVSKILLTVMIIAIIVLVSYLLIRFIVGNKIDPEIHSYITQHIAKGKKFPEIKELLLKAGWAEEDINWAYKQTMKKNYKKYKEGSEPTTDSKKIIIIAIVSILLIIGIVLIIRGVTGEAIHFDDPVLFDLAVKDVLERNVDNEFLDLVNFAQICVQVNDGRKTTSYFILKVGNATGVAKALENCDADDSYDFAVKFMDWDSFSSLDENVTCETFEALDASGEDLVILPSQYILPGFRLNPEKNIAPYCDAANLCLGPVERAVIGC